MTTSHTYRTLRATTVAAALLAGGVAACSDDPISVTDPGPDFSRCENVRAPAGTSRSLRLFAKGVQVYRWSGTTWDFVEPSAVLFTDAALRAAVGTHYAGPTWQGAAGSKVVGAVAERCTPSASAIPWLLLRVQSATGPGLFQGTTFIQRVQTVGGLAPASAGTSVGEISNMPYTAEYLFYQAR